MNECDVKRLAAIMALTTRLEMMKTDNTFRFQPTQKNLILQTITTK